MGSVVNNFIKNTIRKILKRDYLILNPNFEAGARTEHYATFLNRSSASSYLPVKYNYHTDSNLNITYEIRGTEKGVLRYCLKTPDGKVLCQTVISLKLPFQLRIMRVDGEIFGNGKQITNHQSFENNVPWVVGAFEFQTSDGRLFRRNTGHRLRQELSENISTDYYNGDVYNNYDREANYVAREIFKSVTEYTNAKGKFLDVGCATGLTVKYALDLGYDAYGVDFSEWAVEQANKLTADRCSVCNFDQSVLSDFSAPYDVISMHSVIEHLKLPERAVGLLFDLCAPNGIVCLQTLNADSLMHSVMKQDWGGYTDYTHQSPWITADWLIETVKNCGFEVLSVKRYHLWNDNIYDDVWKALTDAFQLLPLKTLLEDGFGDAVEIVVRKPAGVTKL